MLVSSCIGKLVPTRYTSYTKLITRYNVKLQETPFLKILPGETIHDMKLRLRLLLSLYYQICANDIREQTSFLVSRNRTVIHLTIT